MDTLDKIYEMMNCELEEMSKKDKLDSKDVELIYKFVDIIKDIHEIDGMSEMQMNGNSYMNRGNLSYNRGYSGRMMPMYGRGSSYGRGENGYSRSSNKDEMLDHLQQVADMAMDEKDRKAIERLMSQMESNG